MSDVKWIKITTSLFDDEKIMLIEALPEADAIIVIWIKLLVLAGRTNNHGLLTINDSIPYTDEMLAAVFRRPLNTVRLALSVFEEYGMLERVNDTLFITNWEKHQNLEGLEKIRRQNRERKRRQREREREALLAIDHEKEMLPAPDAAVSRDKSCDVTQQNKNKNENNNSGSSERAQGNNHGTSIWGAITSEDIETIGRIFLEPEKLVNEVHDVVAATGANVSNPVAYVIGYGKKTGWPKTESWL